jgi:DNA-binding GntR family transcriptional regulator
MSTAPAPFRLIANEITEKIKSGELPAGAKLPSTREIANAYGVSMGTAYHALSLLHDRDLIIGQPGRGTFVAGVSET